MGAITPPASSVFASHRIPQRVGGKWSENQESPAPVTQAPIVGCSQVMRHTRQPGHLRRSPPHLVKDACHFRRCVPDCAAAPGSIPGHPLMKRKAV